MVQAGKGISRGIGGEEKSGDMREHRTALKRSSDSESSQRNSIVQGGLGGRETRGNTGGPRCEAGLGKRKVLLKRRRWGGDCSRGKGDRSSEKSQFEMIALGLWTRRN